MLKLTKKIKSLAHFLLASIIIITPFKTLALDFTFDPNKNLQKATGLGDQNPVTIVGYLINWFLSILGLIGLVLIIYAGFKWMTARGNEEEVTKAKNILKSAIIGLIIVLASYAISSYVFNQIVSMTITNT